MNDSHVQVEALLARMTLEEKVAQLSCVNFDDFFVDRKTGYLTGDIDEARFAQSLAGGIGQIARVGTNRQYGAARIAELSNLIQRYLREKTRLGIPAIIHEECLAGYWTRDAVTFPQAIGLASTWDPALIEQVGQVIGSQVRAAGGHMGLAPVLDVTRDQRWGRTEETYGEDPFLVAQIGMGYIRGLQGPDLAHGGVMATVKHIVGHGAPQGGRNWAESHLGPRELREVHLFPVEAAVRGAGVHAVMSAYHDIDGVPCSGSRELLTETLRDTWGFTGLVVSDYNAVRIMHEVHGVTGNFQEAGVMALKAGLDQELADITCYGPVLAEAVRKGLVEEALVDRSVRRVLQYKFALGLFETATVDPVQAAAAFDHAPHFPLALQAARESLVLLKNTGVLPLAGTLRRLAVIGPQANSYENMYGNYTTTCHFPPETPDKATVGSVWAALQRLVGPGVEVRYAKGCELTEGETKGTIHPDAARVQPDEASVQQAREGEANMAEAVALARASDVVIVLVGEQSGWRPHSTSGEGFDRAELTLPGRQEWLIQAVGATGTPVVAVLINGHTVASPALVDSCAAVIEAWLPGEAGGQAIAEALLGRFNPGGKLPITVPKHVGQVPLFGSGKPSSALMRYVDMDNLPLFPFGHGLSYTTFAYDDLTVCPQSVDPTGEVTLSCRVTNTGAVAGDEVVQVYLRDEVATVTRPVKALAAFQRVTLQPGEVKRLSIRMPVEQCAFYNRQLQQVVEPGSMKVFVGSSFTDIRLEGQFTIAGEVAVPVVRTRYSPMITVSPG
jgi:beta-glucosidase